MLVADTGHDRVVELDDGRGAPVREWGGFKEPNGLCVGRAGTAYVADTVAPPAQGASTWRRAR